MTKHSDLSQFLLEWPPVLGLVSSCGGDEVKSAQISEGFGLNPLTPQVCFGGTWRAKSRTRRVIRVFKGVLTDPGSPPSSEGFPKAQRWLEPFVVSQAFS